MVIILFCTVHSYGQKGNSSLQLELFGKSLWFGALSYEYEFRDNLSLGLGYGFKGVQTGGYESLKGEGKYIDVITTTPFYIQYQFLNSRHHINSLAGFTIQNIFYYVHYNSGKMQLNYKPHMIPFVGLAYEYEMDRFVFRVPVYLSWIGRSDWFYPLMPWAGVSFGYKLNSKSHESKN